MYLNYFSLHSKPFELLPDPGFLFPSSVHKRALSYLEYGIQEHSGFILITGEVGAGKTTLIRSLLSKLAANVTVAKVFNTQVDSAQLIRMINDDFGVETQGRDKTDMLRDLNTFLIEQYASRHRSVLIIDEAQNLSIDLLEEVRLLSNLETDHAKLLQIVLVGQPELRDRLSSPALIQLRQRILVHCHISPLTEEETADYILYRLEQAGNREALQWNEGSLELVYQASHGIPRLINILCDYILLDAYGAGINSVSRESVQNLLIQLDFEAQFWPEKKMQRAAPEQSAAPRSVMESEVDAARLDVLTLALSDLMRRLEACERSERGGGPEYYSGIKSQLTELNHSVQAVSGTQQKLTSDIAALEKMLKDLLQQKTEQLSKRNAR